MLQSEIQNLPSSSELPCSDDTPVDNEEQNFIPNFLLFLLEYIWGERQDWFFGVDMAVYHTTGKNVRVPIIPDGFLALGVERRKGGESRSSYVMWEENNVVPILALEVVSQTPGGEYSRKEALYSQLGVLYYIIYNPRQFGGEGRRILEVYKLVNGRYNWQTQEPVWMPEIGLGIGRGIRNSGGVKREVLYWFDEQGNRYADTEEELTIAQQRAREERQQREQEQQLRELAQRQAQLERERAEVERQLREVAQQQAERERQQREVAQQQAEQERQQREVAQQQVERERELREQLQRELERYRQQLGDLPES
ncbi:Uma2 family endonuclease [Oscillatoria sp. FACHB-1406]|uniref:Uma2 family endonuclease n=1 Tax=Oscillatoria sp. FACHB-1406 TaxID=2692846 RepID=UPI001687460B|nr:Uma2 family endonuclease [Oscillatoria sp. FACHB-1406]MBD2576670.1 Uma2 family endonuclease [Oscillatoria sp. FACHB-1406]